MLCRVTYYVGHISANLMQLHWGDKEMGDVQGEMDGMAMVKKLYLYHQLPNLGSTWSYIN